MSGTRPYTQTPCRVVCTDCGHAWNDHYIEDAGTAYLAEHGDQCPSCGGTNLDAHELEDEQEWIDDGIRDPF